MIYCVMSHRHHPDRPARDLPCNRGASSFVHRGPRSAEVATPDEARRLLLVADQLQRHHHYQGVLSMSPQTVVELKSERCVTVPADRFVWCVVSLCQGAQQLSLSTTASQNGSGGSQSNFSANSYGLKDRGGKEHIYTTIGLYQVPAPFSEQTKSIVFPEQQN